MAEKDQQLNNQDNPMYSRTWAGIVTGTWIPISNPLSILQNVDENSHTNNSNSNPDNAAKGTRMRNVDTRMSPVSTPAPSIIITAENQAQNCVVSDNLTSNLGQSSSPNSEDFMFEDEHYKDESAMDQDEYQSNINDLPNNHGLGEKSKFSMPRLDGKMVNDLTIECVTIVE